MYNPGGEYLTYIKDSIIRQPRSKIVVDGKTYTGLEHLVSFPKITHETEKMIGGFPAKTCEFEIYNLDGTLNLNGKEVQVYRGLDISDSKTVWIPMGLFYADGEDVTNNSTKRTIKFKGTDRTRLFDSPFTKTWADGIIPAGYTLKALANKICAVCGVTLDSSTEKNILSFQTSEKVGVPESTTNRQVISWIAELSGCIPIISRDGQYLVFTRPTVKQYQYDAGQVYDSGYYVDKRKYKTLSAEPLYGAINAVSFGHVDYDDAYVYQDDTDVATNGLHEWQINDNALAENNKTELAPLVFEKIKGMKLYPFSLTEFIDDYLFDLNDGIAIKKKDGTLITSYILGMNTTSRIRSTFKAGTQDPSAADRNLAGSVKSDIKRVKLSVDHIKNQITAMAKDSDDKYAELKLTAEGLDAEIADTKAGLEAKIAATAEAATSQYTSLKAEVKDNYVSNTTYNTYVQQTAETLQMQAESIEQITAAGYISTDECKELISAEKGNITLAVERNLKIGARNILLDSACFESCTPSPRTATIQCGRLNDLKVPSGKVKRVVFNPTATATAGFKFAAANIIGDAVNNIKRLKPQTTYTLSWWMRYSDTGCTPGELSQNNLLFVGYGDQGSAVSYDASRTVLPQISTSWQKFIATFTTPSEVLNCEMRLLFKNSTHDDNDVGYIIDISSFKLEEGNIATDWSPSSEDIDQSVKAQISMCVTKDKNNNLTSEINISGNKISIKSDKFELTNDGAVTCSDLSVTPGGNVSCDGADSNMKIYNARLIHTLDNVEIGRIGVFRDSNGNFGELIKGTNSVGIVAGEGSLFEFLPGGVVSNGNELSGTEVFCGFQHFRQFDDENGSVLKAGTGVYGDKTLGMELYNAKSNQIECALKVKRNDGAAVSIFGIKSGEISPALTMGNSDGYLYYNGKKIAFVGEKITSFPGAVGMTSSASYVYVVADKNTGGIGFLPVT